MNYKIEGDDLCIRVSVDAIAENAEEMCGARVRDKAALALAVARELIDCEDPYSEQFYINAPLDLALQRVIETTTGSSASLTSNPPIFIDQSPQLIRDTSLARAAQARRLAPLPSSHCPFPSPLLHRAVHSFLESARLRPWKWTG